MLDVLHMYLRNNPTGNRFVTSIIINYLLLLTIRLYPIVLSLTGSWSDRAAVIHISIVQVTIVIDIEHISITIEIIRRERPKRLQTTLKQKE